MPTYDPVSNALIVLGPQRATYTAHYRLAARPYALSFAFAANSRKQFATVHHPATATKTVKIRSVLLAIESSSAAAIIVAELVRITTAPATGNPAITPARHLPSDIVESTFLALPTTAGTEAVDNYGGREFNLAITGAASAVNPPPALNYYELLPVGLNDSDNRLPIIRPSTLEGYAIVLDSNAAATIKAFCIIRVTEE